MSQRYFGQPLAGEPRRHALRMVLLSFLVVPAGLLLVRVVDPGTSDTLTPGFAAGALGAQAAALVLLCAVDVYDLWRGMRRAEPVSAIVPPEGVPAPHRGDATPITMLVAFGFVVAGGLLLGDAAHYLVAGGALLLGERFAPTLSEKWIADRRQRRTGRRYYRTVGEPEKVVWLGASGLE